MGLIMRYLGGKDRIKKPISIYLESVRKNKPFADLTVGGCSIISQMSGDKKGFDVHPALISLYKKCAQEGTEWIPSIVTEEEYANAKQLPDSDPLKAFILFGCSFGGKYNGGFARARAVVRNYALNGKNSLEAKFKNLRGVSFECKSLFDCDLTDHLIYVDPPYAGTTKFKVEFDYDLFWKKMRELSRENIVIVSEYKAPEDFIEVFQIERRLEMGFNSGKEIRIEKLFRK